LAAAAIFHADLRIEAHRSDIDLGGIDGFGQGAVDLLKSRKTLRKKAADGVSW
jgi:hypothetical protein